ncbi:MAG: LutC/YkgG family protein [Limisphaerales bacterium]
MTEREKILARVSEALKTPAPVPASAHGHPAGAPAAGSSRGLQARNWLPKVGESFEERLAAFRKNALYLKADFRLLNSLAEMAEFLVGLRDAEKWGKVGVHSGELTDLVAAKLGLPLCRTDAGYEVAELESCSIGLTECDALVAQTGSVLVTSRSAGGRALSVLPPHHVVLARREQLIRDLPDAFALLKRKYGANYPSFISFITGPSRTGDIERILVLGAHGPRRLTICCV